MTLCATSTATRRNPVKILFYGQSIVRQDYVRKVVENELRRRYPYADLTVENRAIGGYQAPMLVRTAAHDLYPCYPDLVVFHVYGGDTTGELERIVSNIRRYTTAEILLWTHHLSNYGEQVDENEEAGSAFRRYLAQKYDCELVELRDVWKRYLETYGLQRDALLADRIHLNPIGGQLMGEIVLRHFRFNSLFRCGWHDDIRTYEARRALEEQHDEIDFVGVPWERSGAGVIGTSGTSPMRLRFHGNRVDITAMPVEGPLGTARVLIDGRPPSSFDQAYAATLPSPTPIDYRPAIRRVTIGVNPVEEEWTLRFMDLDPEGSRFRYEVAGSVTGPDGSGTHAEPFVSDSGRVRIDPGDFGLSHAFSIAKKPLPETFEATWRVYKMSIDTWTPQGARDPGLVNRTTLIQGIANAEHTLEIIPNGDGSIPVKEITVHRPPLR
jgi:hypothetical protein